MTYQQYLKTPHWLGVRKKAFEFYGRRCQLCNRGRKLQVHHNNYACLWWETLPDVIVLCDRCHERFHEVLLEKPSDVAEPNILEAAAAFWPIIKMEDGTFRQGPEARVVK